MQGLLKRHKRHHNKRSRVATEALKDIILPPLPSKKRSMQADLSKERIKNLKRRLHSLS
jgi:hypothetical protein